MKKLSFASPILFTTILLFAAACGKNTAAETVPPQTQIASESDFSEETSMNGQTGSITPESSATDLIGNAPSETASGSVPTSLPPLATGRTGATAGNASSDWGAGRTTARYALSRISPLAKTRRKGYNEAD